MRGCILLFLNDEPQADPKLFAGGRRLYYGRWDYKHEMAAKAGAAGAILLHTEASAGYGWKVVPASWTGEQLSLPASPVEPVPSVKAWVTEEAGRRITRLAGRDLDALRAAAETREFRPVPLGVRARRCAGSRQAGDARGSGSGRRRTTTSRATTWRPTGTSRARSRTPGSSSTSARRWPTPRSPRPGSPS